MINQLTVGESYSRADIDRILKTTSVAGSREGLVYLPSLGLALIFVTLEKAGRGPQLIYNDWFESDFFHWDSQNQQHFTTPRMQDMVSGRLHPELFVRIHQRTDGQTEPFIYAGGLTYSSHEASTRNPVHVVWESADYSEAPSPVLEAVYEWRPASSGGVSVRSSVSDRVSKRRSRGQGRNQSPVERMAIEQRAMEVACEWYVSEGYETSITATQKSWDLECRKRDEMHRVEVKGTTGGPEFVFLTRNEVLAAQLDEVPTELFVVWLIELEGKTTDQVVGRGGRMGRIVNWIPAEKDLEPTEYRYSVPHNRLAELRETAKSGQLRKDPSAGSKAVQRMR